MAAIQMPPHSGLLSKSAAPPNQTLYLTNLPEKIHKSDLRLSLYTLFSTYGPVLDVVAIRNGKMRGQAHIVFRNVQASTQAMRALQGFNLFGKQMKVQYAKGKSDTIAKLDGTYKLPVAAGSEVTSTAIQHSIFGAPPSSLSVPPPNSLADAVKPNGDLSMNTADEGLKGVKRGRDEDSDHGGEPMEEDSDVPMEASSDEDNE